MEEEILFKNTTKMKKDDYKILSHFWTVKYNRYIYRTKLIMFFSTFLLFGIFSPIYQAVEFGTVNFYPVYIGIICLFIFISSIMLTKNEEPKQSMEFQFIFKKDKMIIITNIHNTQEIIYDIYNPIYRVCEYEKYIYFITQDGSTYVLNKDEFDKGKKEDFIKYLKEIYIEKYIDFNNIADKKQFKKLYNKSDIIKTVKACAFIIITIIIIISAITNNLYKN